MPTRQAEGNGDAMRTTADTASRRRCHPPNDWLVQPTTGYSGAVRGDHSEQRHERDLTAELERGLIRLVRLGRLSPIHDRVASRVGISLDRSLYVLLAAVGDDGPLRLSELATRQGVDVSTASRQVASAEGRGWIERAPDPGDRRAARLDLTPSGRRLLDDYRHERRRLLDEVLGEWQEQDRRALADLINRLNDDLARVTQPEPLTTNQRSLNTR